jgi:hypothetical protein
MITSTLYFSNDFVYAPFSTYRSHVFKVSFVFFGGDSDLKGCLYSALVRVFCHILVAFMHGNHPWCHLVGVLCPHARD